MVALGFLRHPNLHWKSQVGRARCLCTTCLDFRLVPKLRLGTRYGKLCFPELRTPITFRKEAAARAPHNRYRFLGNDAPYFMTMTVNHWLPIFIRPERVEIVLDCWRYLQANEDFRLHGYVVLESHLHLLGGSAQIGQDTSASSPTGRGGSSISWWRRGLSGSWVCWRSSSGCTFALPT
jgi:hypothetical protein